MVSPSQPNLLDVDWSQIPELIRETEGCEAEGILGYVLAEHWAKERCWLGGGAARGLGWCHVDELKAYRFDEAAYEAWVKSGRTTLPAALSDVPTVLPTRSWCFRTLDVNVSFGEYKPEPSEAAWGLDMFAVGPHDTERVDRGRATRAQGRARKGTSATRNDERPHRSSSCSAAVREPCTGTSEQVRPERSRCRRLR